MDKPSYLSDVDWAESQRKRGSDSLTARAAREWRAERDRREPLKRPNPHRYIDTPQDIRLEEEAQKRKDLPCGVTLDDFRAYMPMHAYIYMPTGEMWPGESVNSRLPPIRIGADEDGKPKFTSASAWLDRNKPVEQMTWAPGSPQLIADRLITGGGWIERQGVTVFNLYRGPAIEPGDPDEAGPWIEHVRRVYPNDADRIIKWLAHRAQRPQEKVNHALVLGGPPGIGKDTLLEPAKRAVGPWNFAEVSPQQLLGRFNGFLKSVMMRVSEARDLGEVNRYSFYEHLKAIIAAPPDVLRVDEKNLREYNVPNLCGVIITTNHKTDGIFLPADDRRHYVAWSDLTLDDFETDYWAKLWSWFDRGGDRNVAAYLTSLDLSGFDPKAPPAKTQAFWDIVDASRAPEDAELADVIDAFGKDKDPNGEPITPVAFTLAKVLEMATTLAPRDNDGQSRAKQLRVLARRPQEPSPDPSSLRDVWLFASPQRIRQGRSMEDRRRSAGHLRARHPIAERPARRRRGGDGSQGGDSRRPRPFRRPVGRRGEVSGLETAGDRGGNCVSPQKRRVGGQAGACGFKTTDFTSSLTTWAIPPPVIAATLRRFDRSTRSDLRRGGSSGNCWPRWSGRGPAV
jgi:Family of unknown function (DUF5906)